MRGVRKLVVQNTRSLDCARLTPSLEMTGALEFGNRGSVESDPCAKNAQGWGIRGWCRRYRMHRSLDARGMTHAFTEPNLRKLEVIVDHVYTLAQSLGQDGAIPWSRLPVVFLLFVAGPQRHAQQQISA